MCESQSCGAMATANRTPTLGWGVVRMTQEWAAVSPGQKWGGRTHPWRTTRGEGRERGQPHTTLWTSSGVKPWYRGPCRAWWPKAQLTAHLAHPLCTASSWVPEPGQEGSSANRQHPSGSALGKQDSALQLLPQLSPQLHRDQYLPRAPCLLISVGASARQTWPKGSWKERDQPQGTPVSHSLGCWGAGPRPGRPPARAPLKVSACVWVGSRETSCQLESQVQRVSWRRTAHCHTQPQRSSQCPLPFSLTSAPPAPSEYSTFYIWQGRWELENCTPPLCAFWMIYLVHYSNEYSNE